jgi:hypothetical protein
VPGTDQSRRRGGQKKLPRPSSLATHVRRAATTQLGTHDLPPEPGPGGSAEETGVFGANCMLPTIIASFVVRRSLCLRFAGSGASWSIWRDLATTRIGGYHFFARCYLLPDGVAVQTQPSCRAIRAEASHGHGSFFVVLSSMSWVQFLVCYASETKGFCSATR